MGETESRGHANPSALSGPSVQHCQLSHNAVNAKPKIACNIQQIVSGEKGRKWGQHGAERG